MRRGSVSTFADDGRRHSSIALPERSNSLRQEEPPINEVAFEVTGGCYISYRQIAFAFVFLLACAIASAFLAVHLTSRNDKDPRNALEILAKEEDVPENYVLSSSVRPTRYTLELIPIVELAERGQDVIQGFLTVEFVQNADKAVSQLVLNAKHLSIRSHRLFVYGLESNATNVNASSTQVVRSKRDSSSAALDLDSAATSDSSEQSHAEPDVIVKNEVKIASNKTDESGGVYVIVTENNLVRGNYSLEIEYETTVDDRVVVVKNFTKNGTDKLLLVSKLKPVAASRLFPTLDDARLKASFALTVTHPRDSKVLSNTPAVTSSESDDDMATDTFAATSPMSAYNLAFVDGDLENLDELAPNVSHWSINKPATDFYLRDKVGPVFEVYNELLQGVARPIDKLDIAALPVDTDGLSAPGLIVMRETLFYTEFDDPPLTKAKALLNLIGLVGQQWLGGLVDAKNWTDAWFLEGSAIYLQYALIDKIDQSLEASDDFLIDIQLGSMENDAFLISKALNYKVDRNRVEAFDLTDNYKKGACLISMLHSVLSETDFKSGYADFLRRWRHMSADSDGFLRALARNATIPADGKDEVDMPLDRAFATWVRQPGYPLINVTWHRHNGTVDIHQSKFNFDDIPSDEEEEELGEEEVKREKEKQPLWWVPLTFVSMEQGNFSQPGLVWLKGKERMTLDKMGTPSEDAWIVFNVDRKGYYRVNYDEATWTSLASVLLENHETFPTSTRASLIDDALSLARQGALGYERAFELIAYLGPKERSLAPWQTMARHALQLDFALYETPAYPSYQDFMRRLVSKLFDDMEDKLDQGLPLVIVAMQLACQFEYQKCTSWAKNKWQDVYKNNNTENLPEHVRETIYCIGAQRGGQEELTYLMEKFADESDREEKDRFLSALGCFQSPWILQKVLNEILENNKYEDDDIKVILKSYAKNPAAAQAARRFLQENWKEIVGRFSRSYWTTKAFVQASTNLLFTERDINEFNAFRDENIESLKSMGHWVALNEIKAISWIFRLKESSSRIQHWFKTYNMRMRKV
ncbi:hypothetical protein TKK_0017371 [Trichogramma kaykai]|uniref:Aminopeptidase n=1 Tax=Trichogramma kaykai TaxID=54128 RepID=A0ABD2W2V1_9HYME